MRKKSKKYGWIVVVLVPPKYLKVLYDKQIFIRTVVGSITEVRALSLLWA
jgi:hypothetical protein